MMSLSTDPISTSKLLTMMTCRILRRYWNLILKNKRTVLESFQELKRERAHWMMEMMANIITMVSRMVMPSSDRNVVATPEVIIMRKVIMRPVKVNYHRS